MQNIIFHYKTGYIVKVDERMLSSAETRLCITMLHDESLNDSLDSSNEQSEEVAPDERYCCVVVQSHC